jgi:hypothetical protein
MSRRQDHSTTMSFDAIDPNQYLARVSDQIDATVQRAREPCATVLSEKVYNGDKLK